MKKGWKVTLNAHGEGIDIGIFKTLKEAKWKLEMQIGAEIVKTFTFGKSCHEFNHQHVIEKV